jgi:hypothetical protein
MGYASGQSGDFANRWTARTARTIMARKWGACVGCKRVMFHLSLGGRLEAA